MLRCCGHFKFVWGKKGKPKASMGTKKADNSKNIKLPLDRKTLVTEAQTKWLKKFMTQKQMEDIRGEFVVTEK